jgi:hypothetical protein
MTRPELDLLRAAHTVDVVVRKDGVDHRIEGDFLKPLLCGRWWECSNGHVFFVEGEVLCWLCGAEKRKTRP